MWINFFNLKKNQLIYEYLTIQQLMDFARKQLEKYGWTDGKGLGKHENGISQALKPKLKRSIAGVGYDAAADFTEHWWSALYDKAAKNVEVEEKNGKTKKIKTKDEGEFEITNSTWRINKKSKKSNDSSEEEYADFFVRTDILTGGKSKSKKVKKESDSEEEPNVFKLTDEELFAACEGRTAHKGARHGLKALGKLARIEQQEQMLLTQSRFKGYSHAKNVDSTTESQMFEDINLNSDCDLSTVRHKKKKKKRCNSFNNTNNKEIKIHNDKVDDAVGKEYEVININIISSVDNKLEKKSRKEKSKNICMEEEDVNNHVIEKKEIKTKQKKKRKRKTLENDYNINDSDTTESDCNQKQKKK